MLVPLLTKERLGEVFPTMQNYSFQLGRGLSRREVEGLTDRQASAPNHGAVDPRLVVPGANDRLENFRRPESGVWVKVDHGAALVPIGDCDRGGGIPVSKRQHTTHPGIFLEGLGLLGRDQKVGSESANVWGLPRKRGNLIDRGSSDRGDTGFIENATVEVGHLDGRSMAITDFSGEFLAEQRQLFALGCAHMGGEAASGVRPSTYWCELKQLWQLGGRQPRESTAIADLAKRQTAIAIKTVPT
jgi:hypothetical protein